MDITAISELRAQLRSAAISGASLLSENFRLKRAVSAFAPLKDASPVFGKIYELSSSLVSEKCDDAAGTLLDALSLTDSVMTTLAKVDVEGEAEKLPVFEVPSKITNAPYSGLSKLINALTGSGNGNYRIITDALQNEPELFEDHRVKPALVECLGASYSEQSVLAFNTVKSMGKTMLPLLKHGFDPKGKKGTINRILLIDELGGADENDFYLENIPLTEKDVKKLLVRALRHDASNADKLIELTQTEKGAIKEQAFHTLASLDCGKAREFFEEMEKKKPQETLAYLTYSRTPWASKLAAKIGNRLFDNNDGGKYKMNGLGLVDIDYYAFQGKLGKEVVEFFRKAAAPEEDKKTLRSRIRELINNALAVTVATTGDPDMCALALEFEKKYPKQFEESAFFAHILGTDDCTDYFKKKILEAKERAQTQSNKSVFYSPAMSCVKFITCIDGKYYIQYKVFDSHTVVAEVYETYTVPIRQPVKEKWFDMFLSCDWYMPEYFASELYDKNDGEMREKLKQYFFKRVVYSEDSLNYLLILKGMGYTNIEGLVFRYFKENHMKFKDKYRDAFKFLRFVPSDYEYLCKEMDDLENYAKANNITLNLDLEDLRADIYHFWAPQH